MASIVICDVFFFNLKLFYSTKLGEIEKIRHCFVISAVIECVRFELGSLNPIITHIISYFHGFVLGKLPLLASANTEGESTFNLGTILCH